MARSSHTPSRLLADRFDADDETKDIVLAQRAVRLAIGQNHFFHYSAYCGFARRSNHANERTSQGPPKPRGLHVRKCKRTPRRSTTVATAHELFAAFADRKNHTSAPEQYEAFGIVVYQAIEPVTYQYFDVGDQEAKPLDTFLYKLLERVAERNSDHFRFRDGRLEPR